MIPRTVKSRRDCLSSLTPNHISSPFNPVRPRHVSLSISHSTPDVVFDRADLSSTRFVTPKHDFRSRPNVSLRLCLFPLLSSISADSPAASLLALQAQADQLASAREGGASCFSLPLEGRRMSGGEPQRTIPSRFAT